MLFSELREKDVVDIETGERLGYIDDVIISEKTAQIEKLVINGRRLLGLFGKARDVELSWSDVAVIGTDTIIIKTRK